MKCCLNEDNEGDVNRSAHKHCPVGYCIEKDTDNLECTSVSDHCNKMTPTCNNLLRSTCRQASMWEDTEDEDAKEKQYLCRKWTKLQPDMWKEWAGNYCKFPTPPTGTPLSDHIKTNEADRNKVKRLYQSSLCGEFILSQEDSNTKLKEVCAAAVRQKSDGSWEHTEFDTHMGTLCKCKYPTEYYAWWKTTEEAHNNDDSVKAMLNARNNGTPQCFYPDCTTSLMYDYKNPPSTNCGDISLCIQNIESNISILPGDRAMGNRSIPPPSSQQVCNLMTSDGTGTGGGTGGTGGTGGNPYPYPYPYPDPPPPATHRSEGTSSRKKDDDSTMIIGGVVLMCCGFMMMMVMMSMGKRSN